MFGEESAVTLLARSGACLVLSVVWVKILIHNPSWAEWPGQLSMCRKMFMFSNRTPGHLSGATFLSSAPSSHLDHRGCQFDGFSRETTSKEKEEANA